MPRHLISSGQEWIDEIFPTVPVYHPGTSLAELAGKM